MTDSGAQILIVEDDAIIAARLQTLLARVGYTVVACLARGEDAVKHCQQNRPDVVLMDIRLRGEINGVEAAAKIKAGCDAAVVYLTAYIDEETIARTKVTEPYGYLIKPVHDQEVAVTVEMALARRRLELALKRSSSEQDSASDRSVSALAGGIANDFNNLLGAVAGNVSLALSNLPADSRAAGYLVNVEAAVMRARDLTQQLLIFARDGKPGRQIVELGKLIQSGPGESRILTMVTSAGKNEVESRRHNEGGTVDTSRKVLIMDDEPMLRDMLVEMLVMLGHDAVAVADGKSALEEYQKAMEEHARFDLVILDLTIKGGPGGADVVKQLAALDPEIKAIASSGYATDPVMAQYGKYGFVERLSKPYRIQELQGVISNVLG